MVGGLNVKKCNKCNGTGKEVINGIFDITKTSLINCPKCQGRGTK